jgi:hypothetical protein
MPPAAAGNPPPGPGARTAIQLRRRAAGQTRPGRRATCRAAAVTGRAALAILSAGAAGMPFPGDSARLSPAVACLPPAARRRRAVPAGRTGTSRRTGSRRPPSAGPYSSITDAAARAAPALPGHQRTGVPVGYPQAAYLVLPAESIRMITDQYEKVHVSALRPGLRNFARMLGPGRYGSRAGGADGPPLPKQPRRHSTATRPPMPQCCKNQCRKSRCGKNQRPGYHGPGDTQGS